MSTSTIARLPRGAQVFLALVLASLDPGAAAAQPGPEISLSLRGVTNRTIQAGEPLFVAVRIEAAAESDTAIELAPASGTWADAVEVELADMGNSARNVRARLTAAPDHAVATLSPDLPIGAVWMFGSSGINELSPGEYQVRVRLLIREGRGWRGEATAEAVPVRIVEAGSAPERAVQFVLARAHEAVLSDSTQDAARIIDALLATEPDNIRLLMNRAALCLRGEDYRSAQVCVNRAWRSAEREHARHPPVGLLELEQQVELALLAAGAAPANPPAWTRLPAAVLAESLPDRVPASDRERERLQPRVLPSAPGPSPAAGSPAAIVTGTEVMPPAGVVAPVSPAESNPPARVPAAARRAAGAVVLPTELSDTMIAADSRGQWATTAHASSQYGSTGYSAARATGAPNISVAGDSPDAWCPAGQNEGTAWIEVTFAQPVHATEVRIRQNNAPGAVAKIEAIAPDGTTHLWWEGVDPTARPEVREIRWFVVRVPKTEHLVAKVKVTLNLATVPGWNQIDAVQLVGTAP